MARARTTRRQRPLGTGWGVRTAATVVLIFLALPLVVLIGSSFNASSLVRFPPQGWSLRWYASVLSSHDWVVSINLSIVVALMVVPTVVILGTLAAYGLFRGKQRGFLTAAFMSPLVVPEVMVGLGASPAGVPRSAGTSMPTAIRHWMGWTRRWWWVASIIAGSRRPSWWQRRPRRRPSWPARVRSWSPRPAASTAPPPRTPHWKPWCRPAGSRPNERCETAERQ